MTEKGIIAIDAGTTSIRTVVFNTHGQRLFSRSRDNPPTHYDDGRVEQDPNSWDRHLFELLAECRDGCHRSGIKPMCLSLTSQRSSVIPVDRDGTALHPAIMWQDRRTESMCHELGDQQGFVYHTSGLLISPVFSAIKMRWFKQNEPSLYRTAFKMIGIHDYLAHRLTGEFKTDQSLASRTNLLDLRTRQWSGELIRIFDVDRRLLCELIEPGSVLGTLNKSASAATGLTEGLPLVSAGGDQQCAALGLGLTSSEDLIANTGTGSYVIGHAVSPVLDDKMRSFCNVSSMPGAYIVEATMLTSGTIYRWFNDRFYSPPPDPSVRFQAINNEAFAAPQGANGVLLLPHFKGAGAPHWNPKAAGLFFNLGLNNTRGDLSRAILEGIAAELAENVELIESLVGPVRRVRVSGGLTKFDLYDSIQADMFDKPVIRARESEATSLGAWISAATTLGIYDSFAAAHSAATGAQPGDLFDPDPGRVNSYKALRSRKDFLYQTLYG